jgi:molybdopterin/thiamine biosynthesis adenylyltransferase
LLEGSKEKIKQAYADLKEITDDLDFLDEREISKDKCLK